MKLRAVTSIPLILCAMLTAMHANADVYKWKDKDGKVHFSNRQPTNANAQKMKLIINTFKGTTVSTAEPSYAVSSSVIIYSTSWCPSCKKAKRHFEEQGIPYEERDIEKSREAAAEFKRLNGRGVPVILVGDKRLDGFSKRAFDSIYDAL